MTDDACAYGTRGCTIKDDPVAVALSKRPREDDALLLVICPRAHHLLAAVYDLPGRGRVLCTPHFPWGRAGRAHIHPGLTPVDNFADDEDMFGRCHCGTWSYRPAKIPELLAAHAEGRVLPSGELVRVRHANGQVTKVGRAWAETHGMEIVGTVTRNPRRLRPHLLGNWVDWTVESD